MIDPDHIEPTDLMADFSVQVPAQPRRLPQRRVREGDEVVDVTTVDSPFLESAVAFRSY